MESHFKILRKKLNDLGYTQPLRIECVPLVNKLLSDLKTTTENLQKCMTISKNALDELSSIELCAEPHKCDNVKLIEECNDLHLAFVHFKEQHEKLQKDLRTQNTILDDRLAECEAEKETLRQKLNGLKAELRTNLNCSTRSSRPSLRQAIKELKKENMSSAEEKYSIIQNEIRKLKEDKLELLKNNEILKSQLENRNQEVQRLLDGGRPVNTQARGYDNIDKKIGALQDEICALKADRSILGAQLKGALAKQHEAMRRALHLAERNKQLEKEMKDIDQIALQVEAECNKTVKSNSEKMLRLQDKLNECMMKIDSFERDINKLKQEKISIQADLDTVKLEKRHLQSALQSETEDKKALTDRINNLTIIEHDLNMEIDRLVRLTGEQKLRIAELEGISRRLKDAEVQQQYDELLKKIEERNQTILDLHKEIKTLSDSKYKVSNTYQRESFENDDHCQKACCKRKQRELQLYRDEVQQLQRENDSLKNKIQELNQSTTFDQERMKKAFQNMEEHIRNLEDERRDMLVNQLTSRTNMTQLEEDCHVLKDKLKATQNELNNQKASYEQLKNLHEQSNLALMESRRQLAGSERELLSVHSKISNSHRETAGQEREICRLQNDVDITKRQLTKLDKEKDDLLNVLDEKTEKIENLEKQLTEKKNEIGTLEIEMKVLKQKLSTLSEEKFGYESQLKATKHELNALQKDYDHILQARDAALQENRRLQDDLAIALADCKDTRKELDISTRQIDDLKRQLQHYVAEVKRFEDQISQKELERAEILDQFRNLTAEASNLETTNHTLENEAAQSKVQLSVALDHASDLERKLDNKDAIIRSYEKQIADMSSKIASLEIQLKQRHSQYEKIEDELRQMKDLCVQLDREKDQLRIELQNREDHKAVAQRNIEVLSKENDDLKRAFRKDKNNVEDLKNLLDDARQEVIQQKLMNQDLQTELTRMKDRLEEAQERLTISSIPNPLRTITTQEPHTAIPTNEFQIPETARIVSPQSTLKQSQSVQCQTDSHRKEENQIRRRELLNIQISDFGNIADTVQTTLRESQGFSAGVQTLQYTDGQGARADIIESKETAIQSENSEAIEFRNFKSRPNLKKKPNLKEGFKSKSIPTTSPNSMSNILDAENIKHVNLPPNKIISHHPAQLSSPHCSENTKKTTSNEVEGANSTKPVQSKKLLDIPLHLSDDGYTNMQKHSEEQEDGKVSNRNGDYTCCKCTKCDCCQFCKGEFFEKDTFAKFKEAKKHNQYCQAYGERIRDKFISDTDDLYTSRQCHTSKPNQGSGKKYKGAKSQTFINADRNSDSLEELRQSKENRPCDTDIYKINISRTAKNIPLKHVKTCSLNGKPLVISNVKSPSFPPQKFMGNDDGETVAQIDKNYESGTTSTLMIECPDMTCCISNRRMYCSTSK